MIRFVYGKDLPRFPLLASTMFQDRARQFHGRLKWNVSVDENGWERDQYDPFNPLYAIYELPDGTHGGSGRLMPTTGRTMVNDHFQHLTGGGPIISPLIWESTRFCVSPRIGADMAQASRISTSLMLAGCEVGLRYDLEFYVAVFDAPMRRIYRSTGWAPEIIGEHGEGREKLCLGLWEINNAVRKSILARARDDLKFAEIPSNRAFALAA